MSVTPSFNISFSYLVRELSAIEICECRIGVSIEILGISSPCLAKTYVNSGFGVSVISLIVGVGERKCYASRRGYL
jgi:hypothetical protein